MRPMPQGRPCAVSGIVAMMSTPPRSDPGREFAASSRIRYASATVTCSTAGARSGPFLMAAARCVERRDTFINSAAVFWELRQLAQFQSRQPALAVGVNGRRILDGLVAGLHRTASSPA